MQFLQVYITMLLNNPCPEGYSMLTVEQKCNQHFGITNRFTYSDPTRLDFIVISYGIEVLVTNFLAMRLSTAAFIALAVRTAGLRVILDTDLGDDIDDTWALSALLQAQREEGC